MPYRGHTMKETNSQPQGKSGAKVPVKMGPAVSGAKVNKGMDHGLGRKPAGKLGK